MVIFSKNPRISFPVNMSPQVNSSMGHCLRVAYRDIEQAHS